MRRLVVALYVLAVLVVAAAIAWVGVGWPSVCRAHGWCDPAGAIGRLAEPSTNNN